MNLSTFLEILGAVAALGSIGCVGQAIGAFDESRGVRSVVKWLGIGAASFALAIAFYAASGEIEQARCMAGQIKYC